MKHMEQLKKALQGRKTLIFIDFEGTQFSHEIIASGLCKCRIDEDGKIVREDEGIILYTKARASIGSFITKMTSLTEDFIRENGITWEETIDRINDYIGTDLDDVVFVCFGSNDPRMVLESCRISHPDNSKEAKKWIPHFFDLMTFLSQYIRDEKGNTYSLLNFLKLYAVEPVGAAHNPLNDAINLKNLYRAAIDRPDILFEEYQKLLCRMKILPPPVRAIVQHLASGEDVSHEDFLKLVREYLA